MDNTLTVAPQAPAQAGVYALLHKEIKRFMKVSIQTILAPMVSSLLFLVIFAFLLEGRLEPFPGVGYAAFLVPGLVMMTLQQNAFANTSSSLTQSKITGTLIFLMLSPMRPWEWLAGYLGGAVARGLACGLAVWAASLPFIHTGMFHWAWTITFAVLACLIMGALGIIAALYAEKWDHVSAFQNFLINPLTFMAGVFYSVHNLPPLWQTISHFNPFFYLIDGFRYGVFGQADVSPWTSLVIALTATLLLLLLTHQLIARGWRIRH
ncbi:MAG: ABC transporter permease [Burkholderiaceae bacterium]